MLDEKEIMQEAIDRCMREMYAKSQPVGDWDKYLEDAREGRIGKDERVYERHFLCHNQFLYILNKYKKAYGFLEHWTSDCDLLIRDLTEGGLKDIYVEGKNGYPGYRSAEKTPKLKDLIGEENSEKVINLIKDIRNFYRFDRNEETFSFNVSLGASPCSNAETVREYWKYQGIDVEIDETELSEDDYWEMDYYGHLLKEDDDDELDETPEEENKEEL